MIELLLFFEDYNKKESFNSNIFNAESTCLAVNYLYESLL